MCNIDKTCIAGDCGNIVYARGLCRACYQSARYHIQRGTTTWAKLEALGLAAPHAYARPLARALARATDNTAGAPA